MSCRWTVYGRNYKNIEGNKKSFDIISRAANTKFDCKGSKREKEWKQRLNRSLTFHHLYSFPKYHNIMIANRHFVDSSDRQVYQGNEVSCGVRVNESTTSTVRVGSEILVENLVVQSLMIRSNTISIEKYFIEIW